MTASFDSVHACAQRPAKKITDAMLWEAFEKVHGSIIAALRGGLDSRQCASEAVLKLPLAGPGH